MLGNEAVGQRRTRRRTRAGRRKTAIAVTIAAICALAGCGSSGGSSNASPGAGSSTPSGGSSNASPSAGSSTPSGGSSNASPSAGSSTTSASGSGSGSGLAEAKSILASYEKRPTTIPITTPIGKPIPSGKTVDFINCGVAQCTTVYQNFAAAARSFGWTTKDILTTGTPSTINAAVQQAANSHPDAVVLDGLPRAAYSGPLAQLKQAGIPVVESSVTDTAGNGVAAVINGPAVFGQLGEAFAGWAVAENNGKANVLYVKDPDLVIFASIGTSMQAKYKQLCPSCGFAQIQVPSENFGLKATTQIVSYLKAHPDVNTVVYSIGNLNIGVPAALKAAGISGIKTIDQGSTPENLSYVASGQQTSAGPYPLSYGGYQLADTTARVLMGLSTAPDDQGRYPWWIVNKGDNVGTDIAFATIPGFEQQFAKLWNK
jgi:ribose transport system substrate-binding protein